MPKTPVAKVTIERVEGLIHECIKKEFEGITALHAADMTLMEWSMTAPDNGGYDKCDFKVEWADGRTYSGRYDLVHYTVESPSLAKQIKDTYLFYTGKRKPEHFSEKQYKEIVDKCKFREDFEYRLANHIL